MSGTRFFSAYNTLIHRIANSASGSSRLYVGIKVLKKLIFLAFSGSNFAVAKFGAPGPIRTGDPLLRRQMLYPTELRAHKDNY